MSEIDEGAAEAIATLVAAEAQRVGGVERVVVYGLLPEEALTILPEIVEQLDPDRLLDEPSSGTEADAELAVFVSGGEYEELETRVLAHALAARAARAVLVIRPLGSEIPVPMIELRRGLMLDVPDFGYRLFGRR